MKKKKSAKKQSASSKKIADELPQNASPVCYINSKELRDDYKDKK